MTLDETLSDAVASAIDKHLTERLSADQPLGMEELAEQYHFTRSSLASAARTGLKVFRGPRGRIVVYRRDADEWIRSREWTPTERAKPAEDLDEANRLAAKALGVSQ